jgi:hypothetical protein
MMAVGMCAAQSGQVTPEVFSRTRDLTSDASKGSALTFTKEAGKPSYKLKRTVAAPKRTRVVRKPIASKTVDVWGDLGVTIWRLTDASSDKSDTAKLVSRGISGGVTEYGAQRVEAGTRFALGDRVRLSIEVPRSGYLYVVDREVYKDGTFGTPYLIFPTKLSRGGDNKVEAGLLIDLPAQSDPEPFFTLRSDDVRWGGELLSIIVTPTPILEVPLPAKPSPISAKLVEAWETKYLKDTVEFEQDGTAGKAYTAAEKEAGSSKRQLTQGDPYPQTVYRVKMSPKDPMMINLNIAVNK